MLHNRQEHLLSTCFAPAEEQGDDSNVPEVLTIQTECLTGRKLAVLHPYPPPFSSIHDPDPDSSA